MRLSPKDLYALRKTRLLAEHKALVAKLAHHSLERLTLEIERKYDLLTSDARLDIDTGVVQRDGKPSNRGEAQ